MRGSELSAWARLPSTSERTKRPVLEGSSILARAWLVEDGLMTDESFDAVYEPAGFVVVRSPLLPVATLHEVHSVPAAGDEDRAVWEASCREATRRKLIALMGDPSIREAIF